MLLSILRRKWAISGLNKPILKALDYSIIILHVIIYALHISPNVFSSLMVKGLAMPEKEYNFDLFRLRSIGGRWMRQECESLVGRYWHGNATVLQEKLITVQVHIFHREGVQIGCERLDWIRLTHKSSHFMGWRGNAELNRVMKFQIPKTRKIWLAEKLSDCRGHSSAASGVGKALAAPGDLWIWRDTTLQNTKILSPVHVTWTRDTAYVIAELT